LAAWSEELATSTNPTTDRLMIEALLMHPLTRELHRCRVRVSPDGIVVCRVSGKPEAEEQTERTELVESEPALIGWRSLRGFSADESFVTPTDRRLQVVEIDSEEGVLTVLAEAAEVSVLLAAVGRWSGHWRLARSPLGLVFGGRRKKPTRQVA